MMSIRGIVRLAVGLAAAAAFAAAFQEGPPGFDFVKRISVAAGAPWTDSGIDVKGGEELFFRASGTVSLQKDNPVASCGPEGMSLRTMRQPMPERNLGALIGRVLEKVEVVEDKQTKDKVTREYGEVFHVGPEGWLTAMAAGRLQFGLNDNLTTDNDGGFKVLIFRKR